MLDQPDMPPSSSTSPPSWGANGGASDLLQMLLEGARQQPQVQPAPPSPPLPRRRTTRLDRLARQATPGSQRAAFLSSLASAAHLLDEAEQRLAEAEQRLDGFSAGDPEPFGRLAAQVGAALAEWSGIVQEFRRRLASAEHDECERQQHLLRRIRAFVTTTYATLTPMAHELEAQIRAFAERQQVPYRLSEQLAALPDAIRERVATALAQVEALERQLDALAADKLAGDGMTSTATILSRFGEDLQASAERLGAHGSPMARKQAVCYAWDSLNLIEPALAALGERLSSWRATLEALKHHRAGLSQALDDAEARVRTLDAALDAGALRAELATIRHGSRALLADRNVSAAEIDALNRQVLALGEQARALGERAEQLWQDLVALRTRNQQALTALERVGNAMHALSNASPLPIVWGNEASAYRQVRTRADAIARRTRVSSDQLAAIRALAQQIDTYAAQLDARIAHVAAAREQLLAVQEGLSRLARLADEQAVIEIQRQALAFDVSNWSNELGITTLVQERNELPILERTLTTTLAQRQLPAAQAEPLALRCHMLIETRAAFPARLASIQGHLEALRQGERMARLQLERMLPALELIGRLPILADVEEQISRARSRLDQQVERGYELRSFFVPVAVGDVLAHARDVAGWHAASADFSAELRRALLRDSQTERNKLREALSTFQQGQLAGDALIQDARALDADLARFDDQLQEGTPAQRVAETIVYLVERRAKLRAITSQVAAQAEQWRRDTHELDDLATAIKQEYGRTQRLAASETRPWPPLATDQVVIPRLLRMLEHEQTHMNRAPSIELHAVLRTKALGTAQTLYNAVVREREQLEGHYNDLKQLELRYTRLRQSLQQQLDRASVDQSLELVIRERLSTIDQTFDAIRRQARTYAEAKHNLEQLIKDGTTPLFWGDSQTLRIREVGDGFVVQ